MRHPAVAFVIVAIAQHQRGLQQVLFCFVTDEFFDPGTSGEGQVDHERLRVTCFLSELFELGEQKLKVHLFGVGVVAAVRAKKCVSYCGGGIPLGLSQTASHFYPTSIYWLGARTVQASLLASTSKTRR